METDLLDRALVARIPVVIKARQGEAGGRRIVEVEASCEAVDYDGDVVLQEALLKSADSFVATGHLDIDHLSEFGSRLGIADPTTYIVGKPLQVKSMGDRRTYVEGEIRKSIDGRFDPVRNKYDEFWASLQSDPPVTWFSSIYGWPTDMDDCTKSVCCSGATRYLIKSMDWRSLAFTRSPKNTALRDPTRIVSAKSYLVELAKSMPPTVNLPTSMQDVWGEAQCKACGVGGMPSLLGYRHHFSVCKGLPPGAADILSHAMMHHTNMNRSLPMSGVGAPGVPPGSVSGL